MVGSVDHTEGAVVVRLGPMVPQASNILKADGDGLELRDVSFVLPQLGVKFEDVGELPDVSNKVQGQFFVLDMVVSG